MVYESDFYTTRRPYRTTPSLSTYTVSKRDIPWEKVPFVPRPSLVPDPVTAFGKKRTSSSTIQSGEKERKPLITSPSERAKIRPKELLAPPKPYVSAREATRERVLTAVRREEAATASMYPPGAEQSMDVLLPRLHKVAEMPNLPYKRKIVSTSEFIY